MVQDDDHGGEPRAADDEPEKILQKSDRSFHPRLPLPCFRTGSLVREPRNRLGLVESTTI